jgi:hypothetical protein
MQEFFPLEELPLGGRVARGFADLGVEEFILAPQNWLISTMTGERSFFKLADSSFFRLPSADEIVECLVRKGVTDITLKFRDEREWDVHCKIGEAYYYAVSSDIEEALLALLAKSIA